MVEESMQPSHLLGSVLWDSFNASTLLVAVTDGTFGPYKQPVPIIYNFFLEQVEEENWGWQLVNAGLCGNSY